MRDSSGAEGYLGLYLSLGCFMHILDVINSLSVLILSSLHLPYSHHLAQVIPKSRADIGHRVSPYQRRSVALLDDLTFLHHTSLPVFLIVRLCAYHSSRLQLDRLR